MKITVKELRSLIREAYNGAKADEELLMSKGWYPVDKRLMVWVNPEFDDGKETRRQDALATIRKPFQDTLPGIG